MQEPGRITWLIQHLAALPYNHFFTSDIHELKNKYHIPFNEKVAKARIEYFELFRERQSVIDCLKENKRLRKQVLNGETPLRFDAKTAKRHIEDIDIIIEDINSEIKEIELSIIKQKYPTGEMELDKQRTYDFDGLVDADIDTALAFYKDIDVLLDKYSLPHSLYWEVIYILVTDDYEILVADLIEPKVEIDTSQPDLQPDSYYPITNISISVLTPYLSKKQWDKIWHQYLASYFKVKRSRKRATIKSYTEQMKRWAEWYQLSELQGYGPKKTLDLWEDNHPDEKRKYDQSTVTKAIQEFVRIITPKPITD